MADLTEPQQIAEAKKAAAAALPMHSWLDNTWSDLLEAMHLAKLLVYNLEYGLDADRGKTSGGTVTLCFQQDSIDRTLWLASRVSSALDDLDDRMVDRINQVEPDEPHEPVVAPQPTAKTANVDRIHQIDTLGDAEDRLEALFLMAESLGDRSQSSAFTRVIGDVRRLVTSVRDALDQQHEREQRK